MSFNRGNYDNNKRPYGRDSLNAPAMKRRRDWEDTYDPQPPSKSEESAPSSGGNRSNMLMTFKQFLATQDDSITDDEAIKKYHEYKLDFRRQELHNFFIEHKDEEWFKFKYHPDESAKQKDLCQKSVEARLEVFKEMLDKGWIDDTRLDNGNNTAVLGLLDALVVRLEGGSWDDVTAMLADNDSENKQHEQQNKLIHKKEEEKAKTAAAMATDDDGAVNSDAESDKESDKEKKPEANGDVTEAEQEGGGTAREATENGAPADNHHQLQLHRTSSIFLRNIAPGITVQELETLCKKFPGFLRIGLAAPLPERKYYRRGWITFKRNVNIKEICWNLQNIRIGECDLGAIVNRDLVSRVRVVNGVCAHKTVAQAHIRAASRLCQMYDKRAGLWLSDQHNQQPTLFDLPSGAHMEMAITSNNPLLKGIENLLIEEESAEEDELLGRNDVAEEQRKVPFERDEALLKALDRIVWYLRMVHSVDFYNHGEYAHEDQMPNRAGLMFIRGPKNSTKEWGEDETTKEPLLGVHFSWFCICSITETINASTTKLTALLNAEVKLLDEECAKFGKKDAEKEVEAFITANCVELAKDKWLCPLSGKKFKGPEFVRKHLQGKHVDKLDEVRVETAYFNNYLYDPKRPMPPPPEELAAAAREQQTRSQQSAGQPVTAPPQQERGYNNYNRNSAGGGGGNWNEGGGGNRGYHNNNMQRGGGGGAYNNYNQQPHYNNQGHQGNRQPYYQREGYQRRDNNMNNRNYNANAQTNSNPRGSWGDGRRDPREPITYKDLDAPEDIF